MAIPFSLSHTHPQAPKTKKKGKVALQGTGKATKKADVFDLTDNFDYDDGDEYDFM